jgi:hypothetical protein
MEIQLSKRNPVGRPSKYKEAYCDMLEEHLGKGHSFESFMPDDVQSWHSPYRWLENIPEFREAKKKGEARGRKTWENIGMAGATGKIEGFNVAAWIFIMKNRFGWRDSVNISFEAIDELEFVDSKDVTPVETLEIEDKSDED